MVTVVTYHDQLYNSHAWMDTQQWVANHKPDNYPRVHLPNQRLRKSDKLSHDAHNPDKQSQDAMQNTLDKRGYKTPKPGLQ